MALFTTPPSRRLAYHLDGTQVSWWIDGGSKNILTSTQLTNLNDEEFTFDYINMGGVWGNYIINVFFPEKRDIYKYFICTANEADKATSLTNVQVSTDTTDGSNGTWTSLTVPAPSGHLSVMSGNSYNLNKTEWFDDGYVSGVLTGATGIKGIAFTLSSNSGSYFNYLKTLNLYGAINDSSATQRVAWADNTGTALTTDKLYTTKRSGADIIGGQYLKNLHTNATSQIVFSVDGEQSTVTNNVTISVDGGTTFNALPYVWTTSLASGAVSSEIKVKYTVPSDMAYGYKYYGITATPTFV